MKTFNQKTFANALLTISKKSDELADLIHSAGLYALDQANTYGNMAAGYDLVKALGQKHDAKRVVIWLCFYGKFKVKSGELIASSKKVLPENWLEEAAADPYWEHTPQPKLTDTVDYLSLLKQIVTKYEKTNQKIAEGNKVKVKNEHVVTLVNELLANLQEEEV